MTIPDPQVTLKETITLRATQTIALEWLNGPTDGGTPIVDYTVNVATVTGSFGILKAGIETSYFIATGLTTGQTYRFSV